MEKILWPPFIVPIFPIAISSASMKKAILLLIVGLSACLGGVAQPSSVVLNGNTYAPGPIDIGSWTYFYEDKSGDTLPLRVIRQKVFQPFGAKRNERSSRSDRSLQVTWLRFSVRNGHPADTLRFYFYPGVTMLTHVYLDDRLMGKGGLLTVPSPEHPNRHAIPLTIAPGREHTYWVRTMNLVNGITAVGAQLYTVAGALHLLRWEAKYYQPVLLVMALLAGCLLFMGLYAAYHYGLGRDQSLLYYTLYVACCLLAAAVHVDVRFGFGWLYPHLPVSVLRPTAYPLSIPLINAFYLLFVVQLLDIKKRHPGMKKLLRGLLILLLVQQLIFAVELFYGKHLFAGNIYSLYVLLPPGVILLLLFGLIARSNSPVKRYLLSGSLSLVVISITPALSNLYVHHLPAGLEVFINYLPFWSYLGLTTECFCFALALAYRGRLVELENSRLQQRYTQQLEEELAQRTQEIEAKNRELEARRIAQLEQDFEQKLAQTEMTALRAQMNPHFIFNCLNSIKFFATSNNGALAADYLTRFSRLIRLVLENSRSEKVTLQNELAALELYLEMEAMRFNHKLSYQLEVAPEIDAAFVEIPPLLLQPYVENAIWHGLMHKKDGGTVVVRLQQPSDDALLVTITDNGVGRARAAELKSKSATKHKSFGMKVTSERIQLINQLYQSHTRVEVHDLVDVHGEAAGTEVVISIPI
jgi:signal transduction histidine kinase